MGRKVRAYEKNSISIADAWEHPIIMQIVSSSVTWSCKLAEMFDLVCKLNWMFACIFVQIRSVVQLSVSVQFLVAKLKLALF